MNIQSEFLTVKTVEVTLDPQVKVDELEMPHEPLEDLRVNPEPVSLLNQYYMITDLAE